MLRRVLIANRGEIARRIARTCERLGVEWVGVYSDADRAADHLRGAAATVAIGPGPATASYLRAEAMVEAALSAGCDAVHPGYGFLSENPAFARMVTAAGLIFIGPDADTIAAMGDKATAKRLMRAAGVPVVPGSVEAVEDPDSLARLAGICGYPLILKPVAGGGGKGMQVVERPDDLASAVQAAIRVARAAFGDGRLLVERYIQRPRHIEVQVFGDRHGNVVHLFERECSLQRRHQKIVEEAPAPHLSPATRDALLQAAVQGAQAIGYVGAGTFEFILGSDEAFHFLEVNTRLQVEHPVTGRSPASIWWNGNCASPPGRRCRWRSPRSGRTAMPSSAGSMPRTPTASSSQHPAAPSPCAGPTICGWMRRSTPPATCRRSTTRWWPSWWRTHPPGPRPSSGCAVASTAPGHLA